VVGDRVTRGDAAVAVGPTVAVAGTWLGSVGVSVEVAVGSTGVFVSVGVFAGKVVAVGV
jgi:hypothetical protein